ncbi:MAG: CBS domain-containing protein [Actinomycetota bacterium]|nr:CBS domain-containing protein [Actinomycetota bacterium]
MSPRAAWQLEAMGFKEVYDFVESKVEWIVNGLPLEGTGPHYPLAGEVVNRGAVALPPTASARDAVELMEARGQSYAVVVNDAGIILGRVRANKIDPSDRPVFDVMTPGPTTVRTVEPLEPLVERMQKAGVRTMLVSNKHGRLVGVLDRDEAERFIQRKDDRLSHP